MCRTTSSAEFWAVSTFIFIFIFILKSSDFLFFFFHGHYFLLSSLATHSALTGAWTERIFFSVPNDLKEAKLHVRAFTKADAGVYRCRIDYFNSPTKNFRVNVTLIGEQQFTNIHRHHLPLHFSELKFGVEKYINACTYETWRENENA